MSFDSLRFNIILGIFSFVKCLSYLSTELVLGELAFYSCTEYQLQLHGLLEESSRKMGSIQGMASSIIALERRMKRIEDTLGMILAHLEMPTLPDIAESQEVLRPVSSSRPGLPQDVLAISQTKGHPYRPLNALQNEFRVLVLHGSCEESKPIECNLLHLSLDDDTSSMLRKRPRPSPRERQALTFFSALSYTWGTLEKNKSIIVDDQQLSVTQNLEGALRHMRKSNQKGRDPSKPSASYWWIDAICINQSDVIERNQQVTLMTRIFKKANVVRVWLGAEAENSTMAMNVIGQLHSIPNRGPGEPEYQYPDKSTDQKLLHWKALIAIFQRPWWDRAWVRQEMAVASNAIVHCGESTCSFGAMTRAADTLSRLQNELGDELLQYPLLKDGALGIDFNIPFGTQPSLLARLSSKCQRGSNYLDLEESLLDLRSSKATDLKDKVFSLLGLVDPKIYGLPADYRLSMQEVYKAAARSVISKTKSLDLLGGCQNPDRLHTLPSWVPNLVDDWKAQPFSPSNHHRRHQHPYSSETVVCSLDEATDVLRIKGVYLDCVKVLSDITASKNSPMAYMKTVYVSWKEFVVKNLTDLNIDLQEELNLNKKHNLNNYLLRWREDETWIEFLSLGADRTTSSYYLKDSEPLTDNAPVLNGLPDPELARCLLLPDDLKVEYSVFKSICIYLGKYGVGRRVCLTEKGFIGLVPADTRIGDSICFFHGSNFPSIIRKHDSEKYVLVGEACEFSFVHYSYHSNALSGFVCLC